MKDLFLKFILFFFAFYLIDIAENWYSFYAIFINLIKELLS